MLTRAGRVALAATRGIRVVPDNAPTPEFPVRPRACDSRPAKCGQCAVVLCEFGQVPGLNGQVEARHSKASKPPKVAEISEAELDRRVMARAAHLFGSTVRRCTLCEWQITAPDGSSADAALVRHVEREHHLRP